MFKQVSIKLTLLGYFILVVSIVSITIIYLQYQFSTEQANAVAKEKFQHIAEKVSFIIRNKKENIKHRLEKIAAEDDLLSDDIRDPQPEALAKLVDLMTREPSLYAAYISDQQGQYYQLTNLNLSSQSTDIHAVFDAPDEARWLLLRVTGSKEERFEWRTFYDAQMNTLAERKKLTRYDPRLRAWYLQGEMFAPQIIATEIYLDYFINIPLITFAKQSEDQSMVIGVDLSIGIMKDILQREIQQVISAPDTEGWLNTAATFFYPLFNADLPIGQSSVEAFLFDRYGFKYVSTEEVSHYQGERLGVSASHTIDFTPAERAYLVDQPLILVSNETSWAPVDYTIGGSPEGYGVDIMKLVAQKTGLEFRFINGFSWESLVQLFREHKIDILQSAFWSEERARFGQFSQPLATLKSYIIARDTQRFNSLASLKGHCVAIPKGWTTAEFVKTHHPDIDIFYYETLSEALVAVDLGECDATIASALAFSYHQKYFDLEHLVLGVWLEEIDGSQGQKLYALTQKDNPVLSGIIDKALASFTEEEKRQLDNKWFNNTAAHTQHIISPALATSNLASQLRTRREGQAGSNQTQKPFLYTKASIQYLAYVVPMDQQIQQGHTLAIQADYRHLLKPYLLVVYKSTFYAILALLGAILLVLWVTARILRPVNQLMNENNKIAQRDYANVQPIKTYITEFIALSASFQHMATSIQDYEKQQEELMDAFIQLIAEAIDIKSPYTGGHCERVPLLALALAEEASASNEGSFANFHFTTEDEWREFKIGSWLHDCGKVTTPEFVVDKATKLETISNRIHEVRLRFEILWRDVELQAQEKMAAGESRQAVQDWQNAEHQALVEDFEFIAQANIGGEFMRDEDIQRIHNIGDRTWWRHFSDRVGLSETELELFQGIPEAELPVEEKLLADKQEHIIPRQNFDLEEYQRQGFKLDVPKHLYHRGELYNLCIRRGTLTDEERFKINDHVIQTIRMLEKLPLPENLSRIPEYAGTHHETLAGNGYPRKLNSENLSIPARIMAIADIFEALTASDRPYKKAKKLTEALKIMSFMVKDQHIDAEIFELFLKSGVYLKYAQEMLLPEQIDQVNINDYL